eukprot:CAMPEP_0173439386 /NCGR_PEP_ID=MMETSP1357-20121228/20923_1 /TAXON_ID=77926 /ORGANISM="Hemiselmis rufescens, Strain PCC563" /LENGTH=67 /DNA_ID=CAMNT_0014404747 /DNA_START=388 /DNA_END=591 /DNA_ORIENTATION=-
MQHISSFRLCSQQLAKDVLGWATSIECQASNTQDPLLNGARDEHVLQEAAGGTSRHDGFWLAEDGWV